MSSFIASAAPSASPYTADPATIQNDGWFPAIELQSMREAMRLDGTVTAPRLVQALIAAILHVNDELTDWQTEQQTAGYASLADVPAKQINGESRLLAHYRRAVYSSAKADLIERYRDIDTSADGNKKPEWLESPIDEQRRNAQWAIADIIGRSHTTIELI